MLKLEMYARKACQYFKLTQAHKMFCVSFVLMKMKSGTSICIRFSRTFFAKTLSEKYSVILLCRYVLSLSRLSQIGLNAKIRKVMREQLISCKHLCQRSVAKRLFDLVLANNQIFLNETR